MSAENQSLSIASLFSACTLDFGNKHSICVESI